MSWPHEPVMVDEVLEYLMTPDTKKLVDATAGAGGHMQAMLEANSHVSVIGIDRDPTALTIANERLADYADRVRLEQANFSDLATVVGEDAPVSGVLVDLGLSSMQLDTPRRGFSYQADGELDMRMSDIGMTALDHLKSWDLTTTEATLRSYGEVKHAKKAAKAIYRAVHEEGARTTMDLRRAVEAALGARATPSVLSQVFQAIRIAVNDEMDQLRGFLNSALDLLEPGGRLVVISYHSLEDRMVKLFMRAQAVDCVCPPEVPLCTCGAQPRAGLLTRRVVRPSLDEVVRNPRSRSARLRALVAREVN